VTGPPGDYAASVGTTGADYPVDGQNGLIEFPNGAFRFGTRGFNFDDFPDGLTDTLLIGEKHVPRQSFGKYPYDGSLWDGHAGMVNTRGAGPDFPLVRVPDDPRWAFGSYHPGICQFVFADGSVRSLNNSIDPVILGLLANRSDGQAVPSGY
jgi:hypothetical protein